MVAVTVTISPDRLRWSLVWLSQRLVKRCDTIRDMLHSTTGITSLTNFPKHSSAVWHNFSKGAEFEMSKSNFFFFFSFSRGNFPLMGKTIFPFEMKFPAGISFERKKKTTWENRFYIKGDCLKMKVIGIQPESFLRTDKFP